MRCVSGEGVDVVAPFLTLIDNFYITEAAIPQASHA